MAMKPKSEALEHPSEQQIRRAARAALKKADRFWRLAEKAPSENYREHQMKRAGGVAGLVGIEGGVVSGVINLESSGVEAPDWRPRHDKQYHEA
jgi:hypothetical protein